MRLVQDDLLGSMIIIGSFSLVIILVEVWARLSKPNPEITRKTIHLSGGLGCLFFPFFIESPIWVFVLACLFSAFFFISGNLLKDKILFYKSFLIYVIHKGINLYQI